MNTTLHTRWLVRCYLLFLCTIPLGEISFSSRLAWLTPTKMGFAVLLAAVAAALARGWRPRTRPAVLILAALFALGAVLAALFSPAPAEALGQAARLVALAALGLVTSWVAEIEHRTSNIEQGTGNAEGPVARGEWGMPGGQAGWGVRSIVVMLFVIGALLAGFGIWQTLTGTTIGELGFYGEFGRMIDIYLPRTDGGVSVVRASATFDHPNLFGTFLIGVVPMGALLFAWAGPRRAARWAVGIGMVLCAAAILYTFSRSAWIGLGLGAAIAARHPKLRIPAVGLPAAGAVLAVVLLAPEARPVLWNRGTAVQAYDAGRLESFRAAGRMIAAHPLLGVGPGRFDAAFEAHGGDRGAIRQNRRHTMDAHNTWLDLGAEAGLVTMLAFTALAGMALARLWRRRGAPWARVLLAGLAAVAAQGLLNSLQYEEILWVLIGIGCRQEEGNAGDGDGNEAEMEDT